MWTCASCPRQGRMMIRPCGRRRCRPCHFDRSLPKAGAAEKSGRRPEARILCWPDPSPALRSARSDIRVAGLFLASPRSGQSRPKARRTPVRWAVAHAVAAQIFQATPWQARRATCGSGKRELADGFPYGWYSIIKTSAAYRVGPPLSKRLRTNSPESGHDILMHWSLRLPGLHSSETKSKLTV